jgi:hypothetical protein
MLPASMLGGYSTSVSSMPSCFLRRTVLLGNPFLIMSLLDLLSLPFLFLDHHTGHPACHNARILLPAWLKGVWQSRPQGGLVGMPTSKRR